MSEKEEDYLRAIYLICKERGFARSVEIAERLGVRPASVTDMLKKLQKKGYVIYEKYRGIRMTPKGEKLARELQHRWETIKKFFQIFGIDEKTSESIANKIEHYVDGEGFERIEKFVKFVGSFGDNPRWLEHFQEFIETGKLPDCERLRQK